MNMFACLDDSDNEETPVQKIIPKKEDKASKKDSAAKKEPVAPAAPSASSNNKTPKVESAVAPKKKEGDADRKPKDSTRKENAPAAVNEVVLKAADVDGVAKDENRGGRKNGKPERRRGDNENGERRDTTGRSGAQKKGGRGAYSFGNVNEEARVAENNPEAAIQSVTDLVTASETEDVTAVPDEPEVPPEPVVITLTFDEAIAKRNEARANAEYFGEIKNVRAVDASDLPGKVVVQEKEEEQLIGMAKVAKSARHSNQRSTTKTQVLELGFKAPTPDQGGYEDRRGPREGRGEGRGFTPREGGGRGEGRGFTPREGGRGEGRGEGRSYTPREGGRGEGRGFSPREGGRGGGGRGGDRASRSQNTDVPVINDESSFPSL